ncbi:MAG: sialate O-acetylesterase [Akkermansiaceae bacterium]
MTNIKRIFFTTLLIPVLGFSGSSISDAAEKPVKVFILSGQSNMVGAGKVTGGGTRWGKEFIDPVLSVYEGEYDASKDYDKLEPIKTLKLESFGGVKPTPYPGGGVQIVRGSVQMDQAGIYEFRPGYGDSTHNIMTVNGKEAHRKEVGKESVHQDIELKAGEKVPFKITYLNKGANGLGWYAQLDVPGALSTLVKYKGMYPYLMNDKGQWTKRDDVYYKGVVTSTGSDWLSPLAAGGRIGPEVGFGHEVGNAIDEPVLLLKSSQGNRALGWDFLPPGSKQYEFEGKIFAGYKDSPMFWEKGTEPEPINWYAGKQYDECFTAAHDVLKNFDSNFPHWEGRGYEIVGFAWWQGDKDRYTKGLAAHYEKNLVHLINTLRKEFDAPEAKFVVATLGQTPKDIEPADEGEANDKMILDAQLAVDGETGKYPQYKGNVSTVYTHPLSQGGASNSHYNGNAQTYMDVGIGMGKAMVELLGKK